MGFKQWMIIAAGAAVLGNLSPALADSGAWTPAGAAAAPASASQMTADAWTPAGAAPVAVASTGSTEVAGWVPAGAAPGAAATDVAMQDTPDPMPRRVADLAP
jgi:hypothetical protein